MIEHFAFAAGKKKSCLEFPMGTGEVIPFIEGRFSDCFMNAYAHWIFEPVFSGLGYLCVGFRQVCVEFNAIHVSALA